MLDKKQVDLINQEVDGTNTEKEKAAVRKLLEKSADARILIQELNSLKTFFKELKPLDPPSYLKHHILNALPRDTSSVRPSRFGSWLDTLLPNTRYRFIYAFAGGTVVGILLFAFFVGFPKDSSDFSNVYGTIGSDDSSARFEAEVTSSLALPEVRGSIRTKYSPYLVISELSLDSSGDIDLVLTFDRSKLKFDGFRQTNSSQSYVEIQDGMLKWTNKGQNTYNIIFVNESRGRPAITAKLLSLGNTVYETTIVPSEKK